MMFINHFQLEKNPFLEQAVRPVYVSNAMRLVAIELSAIISAQRHGMVISGPAGIGKSRLLAEQSRQFGKVQTSFVPESVSTPDAFYRQLMNDIGPGNVDGGSRELRHILQVFLEHQKSNGRISLVVVDDVEQIPRGVLEELKRVIDLSVRYQPLVHFVFTTTDESLAEEIVGSRDVGISLASNNVRLGGFSFDETVAHVHACLRLAGCSNPGAVISDDAFIELHALTHGVVGQIDAVCNLLFRHLAEAGKASDSVPMPGISAQMVLAVGEQLNLRYDPSAWEKSLNETLSPDAISVSEISAMLHQPARLAVFSSGRQVTEITLDRPRMILGRDISCDITLASSLLSRYQNLFMLTQRGWILFDLHSTNGCFINGNRVTEHLLRHGDSIALGRHQLKFISGNEVEDATASVKQSALLWTGESGEAANDANARAVPQKKITVGATQSGGD